MKYSGIVNILVRDQTFKDAFLGQSIINYFFLL